MLYKISTPSVEYLTDGAFYIISLTIIHIKNKIITFNKISTTKGYEGKSGRILYALLLLY